MNRDLINKAYVAMLASATGAPMNLIVAPAPGVGQTMKDLMPYGIIYPLTGGAYLSTLANDYPWATFPYQVTCVGQNLSSAEILLDKVTTATLGLQQHPMPIDGLTVTSRDPDGGPGTPDSTPNQDLVSIPVRFTLTVTF